jgi:uncharacterized membrane protein
MTLSAASPLRAQSTRIQSIDLLRGVVMIVMALDHVRDYFHADAFLFNPVDVERTNVALYVTRWITHFCAPVFVFLAGTSGFMVGVRKGKKELSAFLFKRGLWLIILELTLINFAWQFNITFAFQALTVIWALGVGMIVLSVAIHLPFKVILTLGLILVAGHNLLDSFHVEGTGASALGWAILHDPRIFQIGPVTLFVGYPIIPWTGVMLLGYCFGSLYLPSVDKEKRKKTLLQLGLIAIAAFVFIRFINYYGDPSPWFTQRDGMHTVLSFFNVTKYPPSLLYVLITLGPALIFLALSEKLTGKISQYVIGLGRVPMFYYIIHIFLIHSLGVIAAMATGFQASDMIFSSWITDSPNLKGYGFSLGVVYLVWIGVVLILFPICLWYDRYKINHKKKWWLSYL